MARMILVAMLLVSAVLIVGGCDKKTELSFYNATARPVDVSITAPPYGYRPIGTVGPQGKLKYKLKIKDDYLPAQCSWSADGQGTPFTVTDDSPDKLFFSIDDVFGPGGPRDEKTEVQQRREVNRAPVIIEQEEVVE